MLTRYRLKVFQRPTNGCRHVLPTLTSSCNRLKNSEQVRICDQLPQVERRAFDLMIVRATVVCHCWMKRLFFFMNNFI